jgi:pimeloyl-ACP methyl ester carboxylesterase
MIASERHGAGEPLVLLHGVGLDRTIWDPLLPYLEGFEVVLCDLPGHGASPALAGPTDLAALAAAVREVVDRPAHVVGFSLGGLVAERLALDEPDGVRSLTLVATVADRDEAARAAVRRRLASAAANLHGSFEAALARWFGGGLGARAPRHVANVRAALHRADPASYLACYAVFAEADAEVWPELPRIAAPVLAITGAEDAGSTPAMAAKIAAAVPDGRAETVPHARHLLPLEAPEALARAIIETTRRSHGDDRDAARDVQALHRR